jgi:membrane associated rhomboid family serine protease
MPTQYLQDARQRFTEFGGFTALEPAELPESVATWADSLLERAEPGLTTFVALLLAGPEGAMKAMRDDLTIMADRMARQSGTEVQVLMVIAAPEPLTRIQFERWQEFKVSRGPIRLVPWVADIERGRLFTHQGPPFGIDQDLEMLAAPSYSQQTEEPERPVRRDEPQRYWVTYGLLAVIIAVWLLMTIRGGAFDATEKDMDLLTAWGAVVRPEMWLNGQFWRLGTAIFLHIGLVHLAVNSYSLWVVGKTVELLYGRWRMLFVFLASGVIGSIASCAFGAPSMLVAGASGAIFGLLGAVVWFRISSPLRDRILMRPLIVTLALNLGIGLALSNYVDNWNHAGGLVGGILTAAVVGVPFLPGLEAPRWRPGRVWRIAATAALIAILLATLLGQVPLPGPGRDLAKAYEAQTSHRWREAQTGLEQAVRRQPDDVSIRANLAIVYLNQRKCSEAAAQLVQIRADEPEYDVIPDLQKAVEKCR